MSVTYIPVALRRLVEERARHTCEYCLLSAGVAFFSHEVDHVVAEKHGGLTVAANLSFSLRALAHSPLPLIPPPRPVRRVALIEGSHVSPTISKAAFELR